MKKRFLTGAKNMDSISNISESIYASFKAADYSLWMVDYKTIYSDIFKVLPKRNTPFDGLTLEETIGCEVVCAAICHQINWDFLRRAIFETTVHDSPWILPKNLASLSPAYLQRMLSAYNKPERIRVNERCSLLRSLGHRLTQMNYKYSDIFFQKSFIVKDEKEILGTLNSINAFSNDPEAKKTQLLFQNLSEYSSLTVLSNYCKPAIDYHIIREFLRRGVVIPTNQQAIDFIFNPEIERKEKTTASLRKVCSEFFYTLQWITSYSITTLNTIEWWIGRSVCLRELPDCELKNESSKWLKAQFNKCPFYESCHAVQVDKKYLAVVEPNYKGNSF